MDDFASESRDEITAVEANVLTPEYEFETGGDYEVKNEYKDGTHSYERRFVTWTTFALYSRHRDAHGVVYFRVRYNSIGLTRRDRHDATRTTVDWDLNSLLT